MKTIEEARAVLKDYPADKLVFVTLPKFDVPATKRKDARFVFAMIDEEGGEALYIEDRKTDEVSYRSVELIAKGHVLRWALANLSELATA
jgi:hypothetical protein